MKKLLLLMVLVSAPAFAANDVYLSQPGGQANCVGSDGHATQATTALTYFNNASNWSASPTAGQIGPDTTVHICPSGGTIAVAQSANGFQTQGNGTSGHPVIIKLEGGVTVQSPACGTASTNPTGGCLVLQNNFITLDGGGTGVGYGAGTGGGLVQNTLNGTAGNTCPGGACSIRVASALIYVSGNNVNVQNINANDAFDRPACSTSAYPPVPGNIWNIAVVSSNVTINHVTAHDGQANIALVPSGTMNNILISNNQLFQASALIVASVSGSNSLNNYTTDHNDFGSTDNWWDPLPPENDHMNGNHSFNVGSGTANNWVFRNDNYHGDYGGNTCGGAGSHTTNMLFVECAGGSIASPQVYNNTFLTGLNDDPSNGMLGIGGSACTGAQVYNNTFTGTTGTSAGECMQLTGTFTVKNNVCRNVNYPVFANGAGQSQITGTDHNDYFNTGAFGRINGTVYSTLGAWQAVNAAFDPNSITSNPNLNATTFVPNSGSPVIGAAANLNSLGISALDIDQAGVARPGTGAGNWDIGALQGAGGTPTVATPTFSPVAATYTATQTVTISTITFGATICWTNDGTTPTANGAGACTHGTTYVGPVSVTVNQTLRAIGSLSGDSDSAVGTAAYVLQGSAPTFSPVAGTYSLPQTVSLSQAQGFSMCFTTNGTVPASTGIGSCATGTLYTGAISVSTTQIVRAIAFANGWTDSSVGAASYTISGLPKSDAVGAFGVTFSGGAKIK